MASKRQDLTLRNLRALKKSLTIIMKIIRELDKRLNKVEKSLKLKK